MGRVVASGNPEFKEDDLVSGLLSWGEYSSIKEGGLLNKVDNMGFPISYHVGVLGKFTSAQTVFNSAFRPD